MNRALFGENYREIFEILYNKIPVLTLDQISTYMEKYYGMARQHAVKIIELFSSEGLLLITPNGYVTTREGIRRVSLTDLKVKYNSHLMIDKNLVISRETQDALDAFWILIEHTPAVTQFIYTEPPILLTFVHERKNKLIEIVKFRKGQELIMNQYLKLHYSYDAESRKMVERYAIVEDPKALNIIGAYGFTKFYTIQRHPTQNRDVLLDLKKNRLESVAWKDAENYEKIRNQYARTSSYQSISTKQTSVDYQIL